MNIYHPYYFIADNIAGKTIICLIEQLIVPDIKNEE